MANNCRNLFEIELLIKEKATTLLLIKLNIWFSNVKFAYNTAKEI